MKFLGRWLFNLSLITSLSLWSATAIAWPLSYWRMLGIQIKSGSATCEQVGIHLGRFVLVHRPRFWGPVAGVPLIQSWQLAGDTLLFDPMLSTGMSDMGFYGLGFKWLAAGYASLLIIPLWFPLVIFTWPVIPWIRWKRRASMPPHACKFCGYDLRATPERCPECGSVPSAAKGAAT